MNFRILPILTTRDRILVAVSWLAVQMLCLLTLGINDQGEATKYIEASRQFLDGNPNTHLHNLWYAGYIAIHVLLGLLGLPPQGMYVVQLVLSFVSMVYFVKIVSLWTGSRLILLFAGVLYGTCFIIQQWVSFLYTDSVFYMLLVIAIYYLLQENQNRYGKTLFWCLLIALPFFRPVGILFIVLACVHLLITFKKEKGFRIVFASGYLLVVLYIVYVVFKTSTGYFYPLHNSEANVICGLPSGLLKYQVTAFDPEAGVPAYLWNNPGMTVRLFLLRLYKVFSLTRPYFSLPHNMLIAAASCFYYVLALLGVISIIGKRERNQYFLIAGALIFSIPSVLFCVEWTGRMSLPVYCFVLLLAVCGVRSIFLDRSFFRIFGSSRRYDPPLT